MEFLTYQIHELSTQIVPISAYKRALRELIDHQIRDGHYFQRISVNVTEEEKTAYSQLLIQTGWSDGKSYTRSAGIRSVNEIKRKRDALGRFIRE